MVSLRLLREDEYLHALNRLAQPVYLGDLPHVGDRGFFDGHALARGAVVAHGLRSTASCIRRLIC